MRLSVIIPAYNEEKNLAATVEPLRAALGEAEIRYEVLLVNDNSDDGTAVTIRELEQLDPAIRGIHRKPPRGFGRAVREALDHATGDAVVIYMADQSDDPMDVIAYFRKLEEGYDCVFGSRFRRGAEVREYPRIKLIVNRVVNRAIQLMFWCGFNDLTNAFKAYRMDVVRDCGPYRASHFNITIEMSLSALIRKYHVAEIPIRWYGRTWGATNLKIGEMGRRYLATLLKVYAEKLLIADDLIADRLAGAARRVDRAESLERRVRELEGRLQRAEQPESAQDAE